jgi:hypothetical protein
MRVASPGFLPREFALRAPAPTDHQILDRLYDLFSGAEPLAYGQDREWWADVITDGGHHALCLLVLPSLSSTPVPTAARRAQDELRQALIGSARALLDKAFSEGRELN